MKITRRQAGKIALAGLAVAAVNPRALAAPSTPVRLPLSQFVKNDTLLQALRKGVKGMKSRLASDPLSWTFQAAIHGIPSSFVAQFAAGDPGVLNVNQARYWNQCPHNGQNSANFLPWHRAYTHYFERILRMHTEMDDFALPYWDYSSPNYLDFPREFGIEHLDGNVRNTDDSNINPLFCAERDYFLCGYEHPYTDQLPLSSLSPRAIDSSRALNSPVFFGDTEATGLGGGVYDDDPSTRGLLEQSPHDQIHRVVGGNVEGSDATDDMNQTSATGWMAVPPTAGFDPVFCVHHSNIDRLWAKWSCMPGKSWGTLPAASWFNESPWFFFDTDGHEVNMPRKTYFDYRALGIRFDDEDLSATPLKLPDSILAAPNAAAAMAMAMAAPIRLRSSMEFETTRTIEASPVAKTAIPLTLPQPAPHTAAPAKAKHASKQQARNPRLTLAAAPFGIDMNAETVSITLHDIDLSGVHAVGFDVFLAIDGAPETGLTTNSPGYLGPVNLFNHSAAAMDGMGGKLDQTFDATAALQAMHHPSLAGLHVVIVPYSLATAPKVQGPKYHSESGPLKAARISVTKSSL